MPTGIEQALLELREAERHQDSAEALKIVAETLGKLTDDDRKKLLVMPAVSQLLSDAENRAKDKMAPGSTVADSSGRIIAKTPETWDHMWQQAEETGDWIEWTPMEDRLVSVNGVDISVFAGYRMHTPKAFYDVAMEAYHAKVNFLKTAKEIVYRNFGDNGIILHGDGTKA